MTLIADVFPKIQTPKNVAEKISKRSSFRGHFDKQHAKGDQTLLKSEPHHLYQIYWSLWKQLNWKKYLLVIFKLLRMFVNILTAEEKYSLLNRDNLKQPIHMQLSQKEKTCSEFVSQFLKSRLSFECFPRKDEPHSWCISEITDSQKRCSINV